jgi:hypothetical protein
MAKKFKWFKRIAIVLFCSMALAVIVIKIFSPYKKHSGFNHKVILNSIEINAPVDSVFAFMGKSQMASQWSVYVNHITVLNGDSVKDGEVGCMRRCFCNANEQGIRWDETILEVIPNKKRQLSIYNMQGFPLMASNLATEQLYEKIDETHCKLTLCVFFKDKEPGLFETFKTQLAAFRILQIFKGNMVNIKHLTENNQK